MKIIKKFVLACWCSDGESTQQYGKGSDIKWKCLLYW